MPVSVDENTAVTEQKMTPEYATAHQKERLDNSLYSVSRLDAWQYYKQAHELSDARHNYLKNQVRSVIVDKLGQERYKAFDELMIKKSDGAEKVQVDLHHSVGSKYALKGEDVLEFNIAGSGYRYPRMEHKGMTAWKDTDEYRDKELKIRWYNRIRPFTWLPGVKTKSRIEEINANREKMNRRIEEIYGKRADEKVKGRTLRHLRKKESVNDRGATKTRYYLRGPHKYNIGKYSEDHLEEYILELGKSTLKNRLDSMEKLSDDAVGKEKPIHIMIQGHSRGGVASVLGAMRLKRWIADNHPRLLNKVRFDLIQYDPVAGGPENFGYNAEVDHDPADKKLAVKDPRYMSLGGDADTTVIYSMHTDHPVFFTPQKVKNPKRMIITMADHGVNLNQVDFSREEDVSRITYLAEKNGKVEAFRSSGLNELDEGIYFCDDHNNLIRLKSLEEFDAIAKPLLKGAHLQQSRHEVIRSSVEAWFSGRGKQKDAEKEEEELQQSTAKDTDKQITDIEGTVRGIAEDASEMLKALEGMQKDGHKNSREYQAMHDALLRASRLDPSRDSLSSVEKALDEMDSASREYQRTHTGLFKATKGYGAERLRLSKDNQQLVSTARDALEGISKGAARYNVINSLHTKEYKSVSGHKESGTVKSVKLSDIEAGAGKSAQTSERKRSKSIAGTNKTMEMKPMDL